MEKAVFGAGCFWCVEAVFQQLKGVSEVMSGYAGGTLKNPSYYDVSEGATGHAEVIEVVFDPAVISYRTLLEIFFYVHGPTSLNRQGNDVGTQYRSAIYTTTPEQMEESKAFLDEQKPNFRSPIVTGLAPLDTFYTAEEYHHNYFNTHRENPYCSVIIAPKMKKFSERFAAYVK